MNRKEWLEELVENPDKYMVGLDDTFQFKCRGCGKCCKQREDILLTAKDLFKIAKYFGKSPAEIVDEYCEYYIGPDSRVPIVRLQPQGVNHTCPFLIGKRCKIHDVKPAVCALFPLGRTMMVDNISKDPNNPDYKIGYILQPIECGSIARTNTVRQWLEKFNIPIEDEFYLTWNITMLYRASKFVRDLEKKFSINDLLPIENIILNIAYLNYDINQDFMPQFKKNTALIEKLVLDTQEFVNSLEKENNNGGK